MTRAIDGASLLATIDARLASFPCPGEAYAALNSLARFIESGRFDLAPGIPAEALREMVRTFESLSLSYHRQGAHASPLPVGAEPYMGSTKQPYVQIAAEGSTPSRQSDAPPGGGGSTGGTWMMSAPPSALHVNAPSANPDAAKIEDGAFSAGQGTCESVAFPEHLRPDELARETPSAGAAQRTVESLQRQEWIHGQNGEPPFLSGSEKGNAYLAERKSASAARGTQNTAERSTAPSGQGVDVALPETGTGGSIAALPEAVCLGTGNKPCGKLRAPTSTPASTPSAEAEIMRHIDALGTAIADYQQKLNDGTEGKELLAWLQKVRSARVAVEREVTALCGRAAEAERSARESADENEQSRVRLAGCLVAAEGGGLRPFQAKKGDYGWSVAYQRTIELASQRDALQAQLAEARRRLAILGDHHDAGGYQPLSTNEMRDAVCASNARGASLVVGDVAALDAECIRLRAQLAAATQRASKAREWIQSALGGVASRNTYDKMIEARNALDGKES